jgi:hypothetical protein
LGQKKPTTIKMNYTVDTKKYFARREIDTEDALTLTNIMFTLAKQQHIDEGTTDVVTQCKFGVKDTHSAVANRLADMMAGMIASSGWFSRHKVRRIGDKHYQTHFAIFNKPTYELITMSAALLETESESDTDSDSVDGEDPAPTVAPSHDLD